MLPIGSDASSPKQRKLGLEAGLAHSETTEMATKRAWPVLHDPLGTLPWHDCSVATLPCLR